MLRIARELLHPLAQLRLKHAQILGGLRYCHPFALRHLSRLWPFWLPPGQEKYPCQQGIFGTPENQQNTNAGARAGANSGERKSRYFIGFLGFFGRLRTSAKEQLVPRRVVTHSINHNGLDQGEAVSWLIES